LKNALVAALEPLIRADKVEGTLQSGMHGHPSEFAAAILRNADVSRNATANDREIYSGNGF